MTVLIKSPYAERVSTIEKIPDDTMEGTTTRKKTTGTELRKSCSANLFTIIFMCFTITATHIWDKKDIYDIILC